ncbi:MAG: hypothetical protein N5P05_001524 [Chroococcopsis gigantea SAG 12.99]|nr:hypothetical protein [Chlorogloea purpurea SAG 13.99]MDV2999918.1 hypothetical protein [Chroococcopsis gigantea SAG 12.99]
MIRITIVFILALLPSIMGFWLIESSKRRLQGRLGRIRASRRYDTLLVSDLTLVTEKPAYIGDISCRFNALSPHLRCAINPDGPCETCRYYDRKY